MSILLVSESDVSDVISMPSAIAVLERAFREWAAGQADNVPRRRAGSKGIVLHQMSAACPFDGVVGWKTYTTTRSGARFHVGLYDSRDGRPIALIESDTLGRIRTGAATGLAVRFLATRDAHSVGVIGCGKQARTQLEAVAAVRELRQAIVYCRDSARRAAFASQIEEHLGFPVVPAKDIREAVADQPIVVTITTSRDPVLKDNWIQAGTLVCAVGSNWAHKSEIPAETVLRSELVVCDDVDACRGEAGELIQAADNGWSWDKAVSLRDVVAGNCESRLAQQPPAAARLFKSVGLAIEDVALAAAVVNRIGAC